MSSQIASVVSDVARPVSAERPRRAADGVAGRAGAQPVAQPVVRTVEPLAGAAPETVPVEAPELEAAVANIRDYVSDVRRELQFSVDEDSGRTIITVIDSDTGEIIRQIPPEEVMQIARSVADGNINLIDSRA